MNLYKHQTKREILVVLAQKDKLTYEAQVNLLNELTKRFPQVSTDGLKALIKEKEESINNLEYLKDIGFSLEHDEHAGTIAIHRTSGAKILDIVSVVIGGVLTLAGLIGFWLLLAIFMGDNEFALSKLFLYVVLISGGLIGVKMLSGINRFMDYRTFELIQFKDTVTIRKGDVEGDQVFTVDQLKLEEEEEGELILSANDIEIMRSSHENLIQNLTLKALLHKMIMNQ